MARYLLIPCLILTLLATGCADRQEVRPNPDRELADALAQRPGEQVHHGTWLEEHPVVKYTAIASGVVAVVTVLAAVFLVGALFAGAAIEHRGLGLGNMQ